MKRLKCEYIKPKLLAAKARPGHPSEKVKTRTYDIRLMDGKTSVGKVRWHKVQRRYVFVGNSGPVQTSKSSEILADIARFIDMITEERKSGTP